MQLILHKVGSHKHPTKATEQPKDKGHGEETAKQGDRAGGRHAMPETGLNSQASDYRVTLSTLQVYLHPWYAFLILQE